MRKSIEYSGRLAGLGLIVALGAAGCSEPKQEACVASTPDSDDVSVVMRGLTEAMNKCYKQTRPTLRELMHDSSHTVQLTIPTYDKGKVVISAQSAVRLKNGLPDPSQVTEIGAALYKSKTWMPHPVIFALRHADSTWELQYASRDRTAGPSVDALPDRLTVNGTSQLHASQRTVDNVRTQIKNDLRDLVGTVPQEVAHAIPAPTMQP